MYRTKGRISRTPSFTRAIAERKSGLDQGTLVSGSSQVGVSNGGHCGDIGDWNGGAVLQVAGPSSPADVFC